MSLLPVDEAVARLLAGVEPLPAESVPLAEASGRVLAEDLAARLTQPPFAASAMDGYAVRASEAAAGARLKVVGMSRAGARFGGALGTGEAVRIFTGAPVPEGADAILIQENAKRDGDTVEVIEPVAAGRHIRPAGLDFKRGRGAAPREQRAHAARDLARRLDGPCHAAGAPPAARGDPGERRRARAARARRRARTRSSPPTASGSPHWSRASGGEAIDLGIAPDRREAIAAFVGKAADADILVTSGGASVGEHDLVQEALKASGMVLDFWRIAMRPGKPLMVGRLGATRVLGLPGNPVSTFVCAELFLKPLIRAMLGLPTAAEIVTATLGAAMPENDGRQDYVRARLLRTETGLVATPFEVQDSSMLSTLAAADALIIRPAHAPATPAGGRVKALLLRS